MSLQNTYKIILNSIILLALTACFNPEAETAQDPELTPQISSSHAIVLGDISDDPGEVIEGTQPLADYLAGHLGDFGITNGQVRVVPTMDAMSQLLIDGEVDIYFDSVYPATIICDASGAQPFLRRWRFGVDEYYSVIFANSESGVLSAEDLPGNMMAFDTSFSTSGFLLPAVYLVENGVNLVGKKSADDPVEDHEVGFVFSYDDENTLQWVLSGLVTAGATDDYNFYTAFPSEAVEKMVVLGKTETVPRQVVVARPGIDPELLEAVKQILVTAHESESGQNALEPFQTTRFDEFPEGIEAAQMRMRELMEVVEDIPMP